MKNSRWSTGKDRMDNRFISRDPYMSNQRGPEGANMDAYNGWTILVSVIFTLIFSLLIYYLSSFLPESVSKNTFSFIIYIVLIVIFYLNSQKQVSKYLLKK